MEALASATQEADVSSGGGRVVTKGKRVAGSGANVFEGRAVELNSGVSKKALANHPTK